MNNKTISGMKCILYLFGLLALPVQAAGFDCTKARTKIEKLICGDAELSKLDEELNAAYKTVIQDDKQADSMKQVQKQWVKKRNGCSDAACVKHAYEERLKILGMNDRSAETGKTEMSVAISKLDDDLSKVYQDDLNKANKEQKQRLMAEQKHWLEHTHNACSDESCFKHAYWSRLAELKTFFEPHSLLYKKESDKAEAIKQVLAAAPLYYSAGTDSVANQFCIQIFDVLKQMKDVRFVDPIVQVQSYEDPALDPWKRQCKLPFNFSLWCDRNIEPAEDPDGTSGICSAGYGLPPFKLFELPSLQLSGEKRYVFYSDDAYGPMNLDWKKPSLGGGFAGFTQINLADCKVHGSSSDVGQGGRNGTNYNSIIEYKKQYYFVVLHERRSSYWLRIDPVIQSKPYRVCDWTPVKPNLSDQGSK